MRIATAALGVILFVGGVGCGGETEQKGGPDRLTRIVLEPTSSRTANERDLSVEIIRAHVVEAILVKSS